MPLALVERPLSEPRGRHAGGDPGRWWVAAGGAGAAAPPEGSAGSSQVGAHARRPAPQASAVPAGAFAGVCSGRAEPRPLCYVSRWRPQDPRTGR